MFQAPVKVEIPAAKGSHGGDGYMLEQLFGAAPPPDLWGWRASHLDGAAAVLLGAAANRSISTGRPVTMEDLGVILPQKP